MTCRHDGGGGRALADELLRRWPGLRVLYVSGYTDSYIAEGGELERGVQRTGHGNGFHAGVVVRAMGQLAGRAGRFTAQDQDLGALRRPAHRIIGA